MLLPFAHFAGDHEVHLRIALPHDGGRHGSGIQHHSPDSGLAIAYRAQAASQVQLFADQGDCVLGSRRWDVVKGVVWFDAILAPAERLREAIHHVVVFAEPEDDKTVLLDEFLLGFINRVFGCDFVRSSEERGLIRDDKVQPGLRRLPEHVDSCHCRSSYAFDGSIRIARLETVRSRCGPVTAEAGLDTLHHVLSRRRGRTPQRDGRGSGEQCEISSIHFVFPGSANAI